jgi:penicillin-binding protein 2
MTACIANDGIYSEPNLVQSLTKDGKKLLPIHTGEQRRAVSSETAAKVRRMMVAVIEKSKTTNAKPDNVRVAGKTSTAQTGQFDKDGNELCHAWITGFFPVNHPRYAVTVFVEYGGYGNQAAAPVFREIIGEMTDAGL